MMSTARHIVIVGATSGIALECARLWARRGATAFTLVGRDAARLERVAHDLKARAPQAQVDTRLADFHDAAAIARLAAEVCGAAMPDVVLIAHGSLPDQARCESELSVANDALQVNGVSPALFAEAFAGHLARAGRGTIGIIGSVAGDRGRASNYVYGSAKGLVDRFAQGLQHRFAGTGVRIVLAKPGPTRTAMTAHLDAQGASLAPVEQVAQAIVEGMARGSAVVYAPARWRWIMLVLRHLPAFVFNKLRI